MDANRPEEKVFLSSRLFVSIRGLGKSLLCPSLVSALALPPMDGHRVAIGIKHGGHSAARKI